MKLSKKSICIVIVIIIAMINTISIAATARDVIKGLEEKIIDGTFTEDTTVEELAQMLRELSGDDEEVLQDLFDSSIADWWNPSTTDTAHYQAVSQALNQAKNDIPQNTEPSATTDAKQKLEKEILDLYANSDLTDKNILNNINDKLKEYKNKYGAYEYTSKLKACAQEVSERLKKIDSSADTAYDDYTEERGEASNTNAEGWASGPSTGVLGDSTASGDHSIDDVINAGNEFITIGKSEGSKIDSGNLKTASNTLYNILLTIGIFLAVAIGMYLGAKFMLSSAEDKAKVKEALIPYIAGCVVIFGAFIIWKLALTLLGGIV